ncbi:MAG: restriction endonuclease subunit S [Bacteroidales bacterium]|nr:restriction endonuclease subunit S [Bacteroidales bacterium]
MKNETHRLGDYIREVNVRNREVKVTEPMGINIDKHFMPSVANVIGTDLSTYKLVSKNQFACNLMHVGRDEKIPMAMQTYDNPIIVSPAYFVFEVTKTDELLPEYLMMWFCRKEFDRNAWFYTDADVRGGLDKEALKDMQLPVPSIDRQREIVSEYETLTRRIRLNEQMIEKLEATAQALYRHTFVDNIDKQNLPQDWRIGKLGEICEVNSGKTCSDKVDTKSEINKYPVAGASGVIGFSSTYNYDEKLMTTGRVGTLGVVNRYDQPMYMADNVLVLRSQYYEYCYQILRNLDYSEITKGGVQSLITQTDLKDSPIVIPSKDVLNKFEEQSKTIYSLVEHKHKENEKITELQSLLLAKMGQ